MASGVTLSLKISSFNGAINGAMCSRSSLEKSFGGLHSRVLTVFGRWLRRISSFLLDSKVASTWVRYFRNRNGVEISLRGKRVVL